MTGLAERQTEFLAALVDEEAPLPRFWSASHRTGMEIYRNNYRTQLVGALAETFERTARLAGESSFRQAAIHHLVANPPTSWTLDMVGSGFAESCSALFANDPDVGEVAWLEWSMNCVVTARDASPMTIEEFAAGTAEFSDLQWAELRLGLLPGTVVGRATFDLPGLWRCLENAAAPVEANRLAHPQSVLVWRDGERPVFVLVAEAEARCLELVRSHASFGDICGWLARDSDDEASALEAGSMLRHWLELGVIQKIRTP